MSPAGSVLRAAGRARADHPAERRHASVGEQAPERIAHQAAARIGLAWIFPVGIGHDVNTYLLVRLPVETSARVPRSGQDDGFIPRLWAARRISELTRTIRVEGASPVLMEEICELDLRFGILTEYTSYLVQEPGAVAERSIPMPRFEEARSQTYAAAFNRASRSAKFAETNNLQAADELEAGSADAPPAASGPTTRRAGARLFVLRGAVWTDVRHPDRIPVTAVAAYSQAYFALVRMLPELAPYLSAGVQIVVSGRRCSIEIAQREIEIWQPGELAELIRNFRGT